MHSKLKEENLHLKKRLLESQMLLLEYQMNEVLREIEELKTSKKEDDKDVG